jgi:hypothetical protein
MAIISSAIVIVTFVSDKRHGINKIILAGIAFSFVLFLYLHNFFYPNLLTYQSGMMAGKWLGKRTDYNYKTPAMFRSPSYSFEFYAPGYVRRLETFAELNTFLEEDSSKAIYTRQENLQELEQQGYEFQILEEFSDFHVSMLTAGFLNRATRDGELKKMVLIKARKK